MGLKNCIITLLTFLFISTVSVYAQEKAVIETEKNIHDFGNIIETDGEVSYDFIVKNTGKAPLVITRVTASCGCTTPEWTKVPVEPGKSGVIKVTYNPKGRPGPFRKSISVYSNGYTGALQMFVMGNVVARPLAPAVSYPYSIGDLKLSSKKINYHSVRKDEALGEKVYLRNDSEQTLIVKKGKLPAYLTAEIRPEVLQPGETGEITVLYDARASKKMGRTYQDLPLTIEGFDKKHIQGTIAVTANVIENNGKSSSRKSDAPVISFSSTQIDFGTVEEKGGFLAGKPTETLLITNTGKSNLTIYSVSSDNEVVDVSGGRKELKPGASATYKISVRPKDIKVKLDTTIYVVSNDPSGPVKMIKVTAEK